MSTTIRVLCPSCGDVELPVSAAWLEAPVGEGQPDTVVGFTCSGCDQVRSQQVKERATLLLMRAGVQVVAPGPRSDEAPPTVRPSRRTH